MLKYSSRLGLNQTARIFIMNSKDTHIRQTLIENGWIEAKDQDSTLFHLKWVYKDKPSDYNKLEGKIFFTKMVNFIIISKIIKNLQTRIY